MPNKDDGGTRCQSKSQLRDCVKVHAPHLFERSGVSPHNIDNIQVDLGQQWLKEAVRSLWKGRLTGAFLAPNVNGMLWQTPLPWGIKRIGHHSTAPPMREPPQASRKTPNEVISHCRYD